MHAIIYAAGRAHRLGVLAQNQNKILFEFGGKSLLERHVMILTELKASKLYVVTGYLRERLAAAFEPLQAKYGLEIVELFNPDFTEGSALSMQASLGALEGVADGVLLMDGDVLYDSRMLERLARSPHRTALLVDRGYSTADDDPVLVPMRQGKPIDFVKRWQGECEAIGESIGFFKVDAADLPELIRETKLRSTGARRAESYDDILRSLVKSGIFGVEDVTGLPWTEIDFPEDVEHARNVVLPALKKTDWPFPG